MKKSKKSDETSGIPTARRDASDAPLDTETTFADMNVEGMPWYEPQKTDAAPSVDLNKHERRALLRGAFLAALPMLGGAVIVMAILYALVYLWLH